MINLKNNVTKILLATALLLPSIGAFADIDQRQIRQGERIQNGIENGRLNTNEANRLENAQGRIEQREANFRADGDLNRNEKRKLHKMQRRQNHKIYNQKHDRQRSR
jgi:hypothetical protein